MKNGKMYDNKSRNIELQHSVGCIGSLYKFFKICKECQIRLKDGSYRNLVSP